MQPPPPTGPGGPSWPHANRPPSGRYPQPPDPFRSHPQQPPATGHYPPQPAPGSGRYPQQPTTGSGRYPQQQTNTLAAALRDGPLGIRRVPGSVLGQYVVEKELGRGAMGVVLKAHDQNLSRVVALKILVQGVDADEKTRRRFEREAGVTDVLVHPGIVRTLDAGVIDGLHYLALEFIDGGTLTDVFADEQPDAERVLELVRQLAEAVAVGHEQGVVHRDLKPDNVLVRASDGRPMLADFGLARDLNLSSSLTKTGGLLGTPAYMAPEQIKGKPATPAVDVFALGVILYQGLTGELPFRAGNLALQYAAIVAKRFDPPSALNPDVPGWVDGVCLKALRAKPEQRYADASELAEALAPREEDEPAADGGAAWPLIAAGGLALALLLGLGVALLSRKDEPAPTPAPTKTTASAPDPTPPAPRPPSPQERLAKIRAERNPARQLERVQAFLRDHPKDPAARELRADLRPWREAHSAQPGPSGRDGLRAAFVYDPHHKVVLAFGGWDGKKIFNDLWGWDGATWERFHAGKTKPLPRFGHAAVYDEARKRLIVFGGDTYRGKRLSDLWQWNGWTWKHVRRKKSPPARFHHGMVYDANRKVVLMYGGASRQNKLLADMWEWDGKRWSEHKRIPGRPWPGYRESFGFVYDRTRRKVLLHGGNGTRPEDLWEWDPISGWQVRRDLSGLQPSPRGAQGMVHDGRRAWLFGGIQKTQFLNDTWSFDDARWRRHRPFLAPAARCFHAMAYDARRQVTVVFSGSLPSANDPKQVRRPADVWEYGGEAHSEAPEARLAEIKASKDRLRRLELARQFLRRYPDDRRARAIVDDLRPWRRVVATAEGPGPGYGGNSNGFVYDPNRKVLLLFGGWSRSGRKMFNDLWGWDGTSWRLMPDGGKRPVRRFGHGMVYDTARKRLVLFGGDAGAKRRPIKTWTWDGAKWTRLKTKRSPPGRSHHLMTYDSDRKVVLLYGGANKKNKLMRDMWELDGDTWRKVPGSGPGAREGSGFVYDPVRRKTVLFGGWTGKVRNDTWEYDAKTGWQKRLLSGLQPPARTATGMVHDGRRIVLYGGKGTKTLSDMWSYDGTGWARVHPVRGAGRCSWHPMAWNPDRKEIVILGWGKTTKKGGPSPRRMWVYARGPR